MAKIMYLEFMYSIHNFSTQRLILINVFSVLNNVMMKMHNICTNINKQSKKNYDRKKQNAQRIMISIICIKINPYTIKFYSIVLKRHLKSKYVVLSIKEFQIIISITSIKKQILQVLTSEYGASSLADSSLQHKIAERFIS